MIRRLTLDLSQLRLLADVLVAEAPPGPEDELAAMPPLLLSLLEQAQGQPQGPYVLELPADEARRLLGQLEGVLDELVGSGDILALGELQHLLSQLEG